MHALPVIVSLALILQLAACGGSTSSEDTSTSGTAASIVGAALGGSVRSGTLASREIPQKGIFQTISASLFDWIPNAFATTTACPTFLTTGTECVASSSTLWLTYSACSFGTSTATWTGIQALTVAYGQPACGTFPNSGGANTLFRQFVTTASGTTPGSAIRTTASGASIVTMDDSTANLGNFNNDTIATLINSGYGTKTTFGDSGAIASVTVARHVVALTFDHSVSGTLDVSETAGDTTRTVTGSLTVYHNKLKIIGTSVFSSVVHSDTCCVPISGSIKTTFAEGSNVSADPLGGTVVGQSETLTFSGCGKASLLNANGTTSSVTLNRCF